MAVNQYLPFATGIGANVLAPADYAALTARASGFTAGVAKSEDANTPCRQSSVATSALAQMVVDATGVDMLDDGDPAAFKLKLLNALNAIIANAADPGSYGSGSIFGLALSNTAGFTTTRITISAGQARDSTNSSNIVFTLPISKRLDAVWAAGNNNGGRDTASALANGQTWHVHAIFNPSTLSVDALFSASPTAPNLPSGFTRFRRIGSIILEATSTAIRQFIQVDDWFKLKTRSTDFANTANGSGPYLRQITVPAGIKVEAEIYFQSASSSPSIANPALSGIYDPDFGVPGSFGGPTQWAQVRTGDPAGSVTLTTRYVSVMVRQFTDTARNIYTYSQDPNDVIAIGVTGWRDNRGRFYP